MGDILLKDQPCKCGSSDAKVYYMDGGSHCFSCGVGKKVDSPDGNAKPTSQYKPAGKVSLADVRGMGSADLMSRGISQAVVDMFKVKVGYDTATRTPSDWYFPYIKDNETIGYKARKVQDKAFYSVGTLGKEVDPFGWHRVSASGKLLIITEGEIDTLSATQMIKDKGKDYKVVSIPNGAAGADKFIATHLNLLENFEKIILNFDADEVGQDAVKLSAKMLKPGQCYTMALPAGFNEAHGLSMGGPAHQYMEAINQDKEWRPDGLGARLYTSEPPKTAPHLAPSPNPCATSVPNTT